MVIIIIPQISRGQFLLEKSSKADLLLLFLCLPKIICSLQLSQFNVFRKTHSKMLKIDVY